MIWTDEAVAKLDSIAGYASAFNPAAAERLADRLIRRADALAQHPDRGRAVRAGIRELTIVHPYLIRYRVRDELVVILGIRHGARELGYDG